MQIAFVRQPSNHRVLQVGVNDNEVLAAREGCCIGGDQHFHIASSVCRLLQQHRTVLFNELSLKLVQSWRGTDSQVLQSWGRTERSEIISKVCALRFDRFLASARSMLGNELEG